MVRCPYCSHEDIDLLLEIPDLPNFLSAIDEDKITYLKYFPYRLSYCKKCELGFNSSVLPEDELDFIYKNYEYITPTKGIGTTKYLKFIDALKKYCNKNDKIVEIGSSDCYILKELNKEGYTNLIGVEPSPYSRHCEGLNIINSFYTDRLFDDNTIDVFLMMHVFEHFQNPFDLLIDLSKKITKKGKLILEVPNFYGFYHYHLFYYNINFLKKLSDDSGFFINYAEVDHDFHALRIILSKKNNNYQPSLDYERIYLKNVYLIKEKSRRLNKFFSDYDKIVIWGSGSTTIVNLCMIDYSILKNKNVIIVDNDKDKVGKIVPLINRKVESSNVLNKLKNRNLIIMSSFYKEILEQIKKDGLAFDNIEVIF